MGKSARVPLLLANTMSDAKQRPPELLVDERWDKAVDLTLRRFVYSGAAGCLAALLLFREYNALQRTCLFQCVHALVVRRSAKQVFGALFFVSLLVFEPLNSC